MTWILHALIGILLVLTVVLMKQFHRYRRRLYISENRYGKTVIPKILLNEFDKQFGFRDWSDLLKNEVRFLGLGNVALAGATSDTEAWILSVLAKRAGRMFEFGTCSGRTTYLWARNSEPKARITTLTLHPSQADQYQAGEEDSRASSQIALAESSHSKFIYSGTPEESKIEQLYCDSKRFDETPYLASCDLIFVDGSHTYSYIRSDTEKALRMVRPGGIIIWHDYRRGSDPADVERFLNELSATRKLVHLDQTSLVAYRHEA